MINRRLTITSLSLLGLLSMHSCSEEFLTIAPKGQYSPTSLANLKGVEGILVGAYAMLDGEGIDGQAPWENEVQNWVFGGIPSDDAYKGTDAGDQPEQSFIERYDFQPTNGHIKNKWRGLYEGVARCNDVLDILAAATDISADRKKQIEAEARFLRGYYHFEAKKIFRDVPYIDEKAYDAADPNSTKIPNDKDIWPNIEADFKAASDVLPDKQGDVGRPTKWAALAHLGKAYMYQGFNVATGAANAAKLQQAKTTFDQIVTSGRFSLTDRYSDNFDAGAARNNKESIFEVQYAVSSSDDGASSRGVGLAHPYASPWGCCGFYQPSQNLVNAHQTDANGLPLLDTFNATDVKSDQGVKLDEAYTPSTARLDPRLDHNVGRRGILYRDFKIHNSDFIRDQTYAGPYSPKKHVASKAFTGIGGWGNLTANNYRLIRYAHVIMWLAECEVEVGSLERARQLTNLVRKRAANPADFVKQAIQGAKRDDYTVTADPAANYIIKEYAAAWTDKTVARKAVRHETRIEFAMEGHRFFDLVRWGIASDVLNEYVAKESSKRAYLKDAKFVKGKNEYYPLPQDAIDFAFLNGKPTLVQNPAYK